ncbi:metallophosphoesterase family protein [Aporhodopirellula aestuarii]|uniref:Metallophosphoesterase n=1 Tax=Aporhodopirellula aestuarii TaxID=2950107 RepID=A0ABT0U0C2_9BACT|nr:metallophosphoesterase family protein [Aporhodopirellula aestuarii]MCM2370312.1 metallophosphoesterase [Aporhodopirellula aestuarii]
MKILHVSDLHFGPPFLPQVGDAVVESAQAIEPDVVVVSGDLTQRAKPEQFEAAAGFIERLPDVPRVIVPGNHDVPLYRIVERLADPHRYYQQFISKELNTVLRTPESIIVGLDSTAPRSAISNGRIHPSKLDYCRRVFDTPSTDLARIIVAHHHFAPAPDYLRDQTMPRAKRAIKLFVELGVELILGGHLHRAFIGNTLDFYPAAGREHGIVIVQCGTTTSRRGRGREREKNSFNEIDLTEKSIVVTHHIFDDQTGEFAPLSRHEFARGGRRLNISPVGNRGDQKVGASGERSSNLLTNSTTSRSH